MSDPLTSRRTVRLLSMRLFCCFGLIVACIPAIAQNSAPTIRRESQIVLVPTLVTAPEGVLSGPLTAKDFAVTDDGIPVPIHLEDHIEQPLAVLVVLQTGRAASRQFANYRSLETMLDYIATSSQDHRFGILTFDSKPEGVLRFSSDVSKLHEVILSPEVGDKGAAILDAISTGVDLLIALPANTHKVILLLSEPQDVGSKSSTEDVLRKMSDSNVEIYSLTFSPEKTKLMDQLKDARTRHVGPQVGFDLGEPLGMALRAMQQDMASEVAILSGGYSLRFDDKTEFEKQMAQLANFLPNRYLLSFQPSSITPGLHKIEVKLVGHPDLTAHARSAYWSGPSTIEK